MHDLKNAHNASVIAAVIPPHPSLSILTQSAVIMFYYTER